MKSVVKDIKTMAALILILSFLTGSIPSAYLISKIFYGIDIRLHGSGNPGSTNVWRVVGKKPAVITFIFDVLKGLLPVLVSKKLFPGASLIIPVISGFFATAGHIWTPFLKFKGGKGVATGCGVFLGLAPAAAGFSIIVFVIVLAITKYVSLGSMTAAVSLPVFLYILKEQKILIYISAILAVTILWRHRDNIKEIIGTRKHRR